ncbi:hypothetical protein DL96DRAFT_1607183 [Flagelloscypha sp. PMI_526]|nr:hypothetical protein DL96DRAFT_1607183 [Flagelloscypha sp. PMI_526]
MTIFPHELYENILSLAEDEDLWKSCSFVSREFRPIAQGLLFESIHLQCPTLEEPFAANYLTKKLDLPRNPESFSHIHAHIRVLSVYMHDIHVYTLEDKLGVFLASLINLRSLALRDYGCLRTALIKEVFPRLKVLYMRGLLKSAVSYYTCPPRTLFVTSLLASSRQLTHSEEIAKSPTMPLLQSLTVDTYAVDLCAKSLKSIILAEHAWGLHSRNASLSSADNLLAHLYSCVRGSSQRSFAFLRAVQP